MFTASVLLQLVAALGLASANTVITYPGWRGNNLISNGSAVGQVQVDGGNIGVTYDNGSFGFPYGMQYMYPCTCAVAP